VRRLRDLPGDSRKVIRLGLLGHLSFLAIALVWKFTIKRRSSNPYVSIVSPDKLLCRIWISPTIKAYS
jgi:hypothetical protein